LDDMQFYSFDTSGCERFVIEADTGKPSALWAPGLPMPPLAGKLGQTLRPVGCGPAHATLH